jgi:pyruvate dehydrogenase (quinone)
VRPNDDELRRFAELLNDGSRADVVLRSRLRRARRGGRACPQAEAPIVHALRGKEHIEYDNPLDVGMTGLSGSRPDTGR